VSPEGSQLGQQSSGKPTRWQPPPSTEISLSPQSSKIGAQAGPT
jgi:hypothetical protein